MNEGTKTNEGRERREPTMKRGESTSWKRMVVGSNRMGRGWMDAEEYRRRKDGRKRKEDDDDGRVLGGVEQKRGALGSAGAIACLVSSWCVCLRFVFPPPPFLPSIAGGPTLLPPLPQSQLPDIGLGLLLAE
jgi:hypothetical protein